MHLLKLTPKTLKAKSRLREAGTTEHWIIIREADEVAFSDKPGPWYYIRPDNTSGDDRHNRWVNRHNDADFNVEFL
jgi:hypothetical protein